MLRGVFRLLFNEFEVESAHAADWQRAEAVKPGAGVESTKFGKADPLNLVLAMRSRDAGPSATCGRLTAVINCL